MKKVMVLLALGAIGAGVAAWAAPMPRKADAPAGGAPKPAPEAR